jgi:hypothetical protein
MASLAPDAIRDAKPADYPSYVALVRELGIDDPIASLEQWRAHIMPRMLAGRTGSHYNGPR